MLERIIAGIVIGLVAGFLLSVKFDESSNTKNIVIGFLALVVIAFVGSSFMFGAVYGAMAVGEIAFGYWISNSVSGNQKT
ncbi:MAG: hypothetical protein KBT87_12570 [Gammaproteobacteria bacterium]|jgi:hypothetical protein|nr:hypothetical protein [Gammaproteobacteria bacterium]MBQ0775502.1 hypothetical protein [Gammaproteobacteria bacterium]